VLALAHTFSGGWAVHRRRGKKIEEKRKGKAAKPARGRA
jgi:hypothetical protein